MSHATAKIFVGLSQVTYEGEPFDMGYGITIRSVYAHLFAAPVMAFAQAPEGKSHPGPWRKASGGFAYDIEVELAIPVESELPGGLSAEETATLIASILRLNQHFYLMAPVISDQPFDAAATSSQEPVLRQMEIEPRIVSAGSAEMATIRPKDLVWVRSVCPQTAQLLKIDRRLRDALSAVDACTINGRIASALLLAWGALEELFAPGSRSEIRYRVSSNIAAFVEPIGQGRLELAKQVRRLYDARSQVAHSARDADVGDLLHTFVILRLVLIKMLHDGTIPHAGDFEEALFIGQQTTPKRK